MGGGGGGGFEADAGPLAGAVVEPVQARQLHLRTLAPALPLSVCLSVCLSLCLSLCLTVCVCVCVTVSLSV